MCEAGRIRHHLKHNLWDARSSVIFVGYQAEGTLGKLLVEGVKDITLFGEAVHVNAEIYNLEGFSEEGLKDEEIQDVRQQISSIHRDIENILYNTDLAMGRNVSEEKLVRINNIVQELAKATLVLGSVVTEEDR